VRVQDGVAVIEINNPPVNALSAGVPEGLSQAFASLEGQPDVVAAIVIGAGRTFIAGADINELERAAWDPGATLPEMHALLAQIEDSSRPVIMALHGTVLGGGLEVAMAGHYRVAAPETRLGQPEVNLGIIPGAEGTQRLPRLIGVERAIDMCVSGKPIAAADALTAGLVDRIVDGELLAGAIAFAREVVEQGGAHPRTRELTEKLGSPELTAQAVAAARIAAPQVRRHQVAPLAAVAAIEAAATLPFDAGCQRERELFAECVRSEPCKALVHAFLAERSVSKVADVPRDTPVAPVRPVAIIGSGTMGGGFAMACANAGLQSTLIDVSTERLDAGFAAISKTYQSSVSRGRLTPAAADARIASIGRQVSYDGLESADLIVEAVFEDMALKRQLFAELDRRARPGCILATNTSTLDIDAIAGATSRPESVVGLHFFSPAQVMRLLEVVRGRATSPQVLASVLALGKTLGKVAVVVRNGIGFAGNRMMFPYMYEAQFLVEDGATPQQVDHALTDWGMAMGIFAVDDLGGLDVAWRIRRELHQFDDSALRKPLVSDKLVEIGRLGQKAGKGWYRYAGDRKPIVDPEVQAIIDGVTAAAGIERRSFSDEEIVERTVFALINEGARVLADGIASRAADLDVIYVNGYGFPAFRGGPMFYADRVGLAHVYARVEQFHRTLGARWAPAPLLERLARDGSTFRDFDRSRRP
jgi:3-hydroxyacyl-CoA dehydrogenase